MLNKIKYNKIPFNSALYILWLIILFGFFVSKSIAQPFIRFDYLQVYENEHELLYPWTGGLNSVQFGKADVNNDGKKDLIVFDKSNEKYCVFITTNTNSINYKFNSSYGNYFPSIKAWMSLKDYNCDGIEDFFTVNNEGNIKVYRGFYKNDTLNFSLQQDGFFYQGLSGFLNVYTADVLKPAIVDVNNDGDIDVISFDLFGNRLNYYENLRVENGFKCDSLFFKKTDNCWGNIRDNFSASYDLRDTCSFKFNRIGANEQILHTGSAVEAIKFNNQKNVTDLVIGSVDIPTLTMLYNGGNTTYGSILKQDSEYPRYDVSFNAGSMPSPHFIDANNDGKSDLLVSTFNSIDINVDNIWYYKNLNTDTIKLQLQQKNFLIDEMMDVGENSIPCFYDVDGDGLKDIIIGSGGYRSSASTNYKLVLYKNIGTATDPKFKLENSDFLDVSSFNVKDLAPNAGDIDNDGDTDFVVGISDGRILYWENTALVGNTPNLNYRTFLVDSTNTAINVGKNATPYIIDLNRDGINDLFIGERNGNVNYYTGYSLNSIKLSKVTDSIGYILSITPNNSLGFTQPTVADINNDGKYDLILGTNLLDLLFYDNVEDNWTSRMQPATPLTSPLGTKATATIADITADNKLELLTGSIDGGLIIYSQSPPVDLHVGIQQTILKNLDFNIYPNPSNNIVYIDIETNLKYYQIEIYNTIGKVEFSYKNQLNNKIEINTTSLANGIYIVKISNNENIGFKKLIIQH